jgi:hypothetical protein
MRSILIAGLCLSSALVTASTPDGSEKPAGLWWADFDRDGLPDAFMISSTGSARLVRNRGDGTFADVRTSGQFVSTAGGAPLVVSSTTKVANLNADLIDGLDASAFSQLGQTIEGSEITAGTITGADIASTTIDSDKFASPMTAQTFLSISTSSYAATIENTGASGIRDGLRVTANSGSAYGVWSVNNGLTGSAYAVRAQSDSTTGRGVFGEATTMGATVAYGVYGEANNSAAFGVFSSGDFGGTGAKYFIQPHPTDATKQINFACLEGNESGTYFRGSIRVQGGVATVVVPESFRLVTEADSVTATATAVGAPALVWIQSQTLEQIVVSANADVTVNYMVTGTRRGFRGLETIRETSSPSTAGCRSDCSTAPSTASCSCRTACSTPT